MNIKLEAVYLVWCEEVVQLFPWHRMVCCHKKKKKKVQQIKSCTDAKTKHSGFYLKQLNPNTKFQTFQVSSVDVGPVL